MNLRPFLAMIILSLVGHTTAQAAVDLNDSTAVKAASAESLAAAVKAEVENARKTAATPEAAEAETAAIVKAVFSKLSADDAAKSDAIIAALSTIPGLSAVKVAAIASSAQPSLAAAIDRAVIQITKTDPLLGTGPGNATTGSNESVFTGNVQSQE